MYIDQRNLNNPNFSIREKNEILIYLKALLNNNLVSESKYGQSLPEDYEDKKYISVQVGFPLPPYSVFLCKELDGFYQPIARATGLQSQGNFNPYIESDSNRYIYVTNGSMGIDISSSSSSSSDSASVQCYILGSHRPHLLRYSDSGPHHIGDRMDVVNDESLTIHSTFDGPLTCVSESDNTKKLVWVVAHHNQISYVPWVQTCTNSRFSSYPSETGANTYLVRRGNYDYNNSSIGSNSLNFIPDSPAQYYIANTICHNFPQNTITMMSRDHSLWYLFPLCKSSSSSSSFSSSSLSSSSSSSLSSSQPVCNNCACTWQWNGFNWAFVSASICTPGTPNCLPLGPFCRCNPPSTSGTFGNEIRLTNCFIP